MISKRYQTLLLRFLLAFICIGSIALFVGQKLLNSNIEILLKQYQTTLASQIFKTIEQDVLVNNYRSATQKLRTNFSQKDLSLIIVKRVSGTTKTIFIGSLKDTDIYQVISIPLFFDYQKQSKWGSIEFHFNDASLFESKRFFKIFFIANQLLILTIVIIIFYFIFKSFKNGYRQYNQEALKIIKNPESYENNSGDNLDDEVLKNLHNMSREIIQKNIELKATARHEETIKVSRQLAHDIRSPLSALESILEDVKFQSHSKEDIFNKAIGRVQNIANNLLGVEGRNELKTLKIHEAINEIISEKKSMSDIHIAFEYDTKQKLSTNVDIFEIKRIFSNLINNSIEAHSKNIKIFLTVEESELKLIVKDDGDGISREVLEKLNSSQHITHGKDSGHGLGTLHARDYFKKIGGTMVFTSTLGESSEVEMTVPLINKATYIHLDDDLLVSMVWQAAAKKKSINLKSYETFTDLEKELSSFSKDSLFYIDFDLDKDTLNGLEVCQKLHALGFLNLNLSTGHSPEEFSSSHFLKSVIGKDCPF